MNSYKNPRTPNISQRCTPHVISSIGKILFVLVSCSTVGRNRKEHGRRISSPRFAFELRLEHRSRRKYRDVPVGEVASELRRNDRVPGLSLDKGSPKPAVVSYSDAHPKVGSHARTSSPLIMNSSQWMIFDRRVRCLMRFIQANRSL